ncbi:biopolymer transport protein ExbB [Dysgonomonadaceae bacterium PH5-43]|nr:biopolymer transport protein ExbB [Dysgonomonadaceae bacterium PH5-43]
MKPNHYFVFMKRLLLLIIIMFASVSLWANVEPDFVSEINTQTMHQAIKTKFVEGSVVFMSFIALALILGLAFCLERIIYLNLSQINTKKFLLSIEEKLKQDDLTGAMDLARNTRGPVASVCYQALLRYNEDIDMIDKSITSYGSVQVGLMEKNLSWISLFIATAPSLGFLGTVIGMIQSFDKIQQYGDINSSIVAGGMKFALITTVGGLIVGLILQFFYNYILSKIEEIIRQMEDDSIVILDMIIKAKKK